MVLHHGPLYKYDKYDQFHRMPMTEKSIQKYMYMYVMFALYRLFIAESWTMKI